MSARGKRLPQHHTVPDYLSELRQLDFARRTLLSTYFTLMYYLLYGAAKVVVGAVSRSLLLCVSGVNTLLLGMAKILCVAGVRTRRHMVLYSGCAGALLMASGLVYAVYLAGAIVSRRRDFSTTGVSVFVAAASVCELILAIRGVLIARTQHLLLFDLKVISLSSALNALMLAQASVLSLVVWQDLSMYNGLFSSGMGLITMCLGALLVVRTGRARKKTGLGAPPPRLAPHDIKIFIKKE